jgi:hypothetical protein
MKTCSRCKFEGPDDRFYRRVCKVCRGKDRAKRRKLHPQKYSRNRYLRREYGITLVEFDTLLASQDGKCMGCCERIPTDLDHNHTNGKIRGILCHSCNLILGHAKDNPTVLESLAYYLRTNG